VRCTEATLSVRFAIPTIFAPRSSLSPGLAGPPAVRSLGWRGRSAYQRPRSSSGSAIRPADSFVRSRSHRGLDVAALFYSLIESAKVCGVEPKAYLRHAMRAALADRAAVTLPHTLLT
jgi:hypothetical protein